MTVQPTRTNLRTRIRDFATMMDGVIDCASAARSGRKPSRDALRRAGIGAEGFYPADRG